MSFIGPELPSHLKNDEDEPSETGPPIIAQQSTLNIYDQDDDDDDDGPKPAAIIGPSIPPEFLKPPESNDDHIGANLPPHLRKEAGPTAGPSTGKRQVGPTFPSYAPTYDPTTYHNDEDDDDDFGPKPLPAGMQHHQTDAVKEFIEREEKRRKLAEACTISHFYILSLFLTPCFQQDAAKPKRLQRDEWMLVPPSSSSLLGSKLTLLFSTCHKKKNLEREHRPRSN